MRFKFGMSIRAIHIEELVRIAFLKPSRKGLGWIIHE